MKTVRIKSILMDKPRVLEYMRHLEKNLLDPKTPQSLIKGFKDTYAECQRKLKDL